MKRILFGFVVLAIAVSSSGQGSSARALRLDRWFTNAGMPIPKPPGYTFINMRYEWTAGYFDSSVHVPGYNGTPSGVRVGSWVGSGAIAMDTLNHRFYIYSGGSWLRLAKFSEITGSTNSNVGSGYRWAIPNTNNIKTLTATNGLTPDSATSNQIGVKLGGTLTGATDVTMGGQTFRFYNASDKFVSYNGTDLIMKSTAGYKFDVQISGSNASELYASDDEMSMFTQSGSEGTTAKLRANQDLVEAAVSAAYPGGNDQASARADYDAGSNDLSASLVVHPVSSINYGFNVDRNLHQERIGMATSINNNNFRGIRIDSLWQVFIDSLTNLSTQDQLIGIVNSSGKLGQVTVGTGLSLISGNLTATGAASTVPISGLLAATGTNTINNANYKQEWQWNTLTGDGLKLSSNSTTAASGQTVLNVALSGTNAGAADSYAAQFSNTHADAVHFSGSIGIKAYAAGAVWANSAGIFLVDQASATSNVGISVTASGASATTNTGILCTANGASASVNQAAAFSASGGAANYAIIVPASSGNVGIGNSAPAALFSVGSTSQFQVDASGVATIGGVVIPTISSTNTFTNKRWTARVGSTTSSATPTINTDNVDIYKLTAQAAAITSFTSNLSGTAVDGDVLEIQITDDGTARAITWGTSFVSSTVTLPTTTVISTTLSVIFQYYTTSSYGNNKWVCVNYY